MTAIWKFPRRIRASVARVLWRLTRPARTTPAIAAIDPLIRAARAAHRPTRTLYAKRQQIRIEEMRRILDR